MGLVKCLLVKECSYDFISVYFQRVLEKRNLQLKSEIPRTFLVVSFAQRMSISKKYTISTCGFCFVL